MVRLKVAYSTYPLRTAYLFQFQDGTIKSLMYLMLIILLHVFQFQDGTIKSVFAVVEAIFAAAISIPRWYD